MAPLGTQYLTIDLPGICPYALPMPRLARVVVPGVPHHITQRGVRSLRVFFGDADRRMYLALLAEQGEQHGVEFQAYCLMTNHIHLVAIPKRKESLARAIGEAHRRYTRMINSRKKVSGYLFQGRFFSCPLDDEHFLAAVRYVELNPVRAKKVPKAWDYRWSSCRFHVGLRQRDVLVPDRDLLGLETQWRRHLRDGDDRADLLRKKTRTGRPCGSLKFVRRMEKRTGRTLQPQRPGPKSDS